MSERRGFMSFILGGESEAMIEQIATETLSSEAAYMAVPVNYSDWAVLFVEASITRPTADGSNSTVVINLSDSASGEQGEIARIGDLIPASGSSASVTKYKGIIFLPMKAGFDMVFANRGHLNKSNSYQTGGESRAFNTSAAYVKVRTWSNNFGVGSTLTVWGIRK